MRLLEKLGICCFTEDNSEPDPSSEELEKLGTLSAEELPRAFLHKSENYLVQLHESAILDEALKWEAYGFCEEIV